jgi:hypothetical protein
VAHYRRSWKPTCTVPGKTCLETSICWFLMRCCTTPRIAHVMGSRVSFRHCSTRLTSRFR